MVRKIYYTVAKDGNSISPSKKMFGGMQYEDNATVISFMIDPDMTGDDMIWRIDFDSAEAGYDPGEGIQGSVVFERPLPYKFTRFGGDVQATLVGTKVNENLEPVKVVYSIPVFVYLKKVDKHEETDDIIALNVSASEAKAAASARAAKEAEENAATSASSAEDAMEQTLAAKKVLEEDSVFVFRGGGADGGGVVELVVEDFLSETSTNPPTNRVVALKLQEHNYLILSNAANLKSLEELVDSLGASVSVNHNNIAEVTEEVSALKTTSQELAEALYTINQRPYIVESGQSGIWHYKKLSDGTAECYGVTEDISMDLTTMTHGELYYANFSYDLMPGLFVGIPAINVNTISFGGLKGISINTVSSEKFGAFVWDSRPETRDIQFSIECRGRWK